ncbi:MAG: anti-sigma factor antagonist [Acidimicrobiia bacterium]|nr:anti-sigma factor antagonist [Acidimicrobiia bacterium]
MFPQLVLVSTALARDASVPPAGRSARATSRLPIGWRVTDDGARCLVTVSGELDVATGPLLAQALRAEAARATGGIGLDLRAVTFMDAAGLRAVVDAANALGQRGQQLTLSRPSHSVRRLLEATAMTAHFAVAPHDWG